MERGDGRRGAPVDQIHIGKERVVGGLSHHCGKTRNVILPFVFIPMHEAEAVAE
jgi:hypothetical protein